MNNILIYDAVCKILKGNSVRHRYEGPAFALVSMYSTDDWGLQIYNHNLNKITSSHIYNTGHATNTSSEMANSYYTYATSNGVTSSTSNRGNGTSMVSHLGHNCIQLSADGTHSFANNNLETQTTVGTWLHNTTPHLTISAGKQGCWLSPRSYAVSDITTHGDPESIAALGDSLIMGTISYNQKLKSMAVVESDGKHNFRVLRWDNIQTPTHFLDNKGFWSQLGEPDAVSEYCTAAPSRSNDEDNYRGVVVLCDNKDVVVVKMAPSKKTYALHFVSDSGTTYTTPTDAVWSNSYSTSYGYDKGNQYGIRYQLSNNGRYVIAYSPMYYYGSGYTLFVIRVEDGVMLRSNKNDSSYGYNFAPVGDCDFVMTKSVNADGAVGVTLSYINVASQFVNAHTGDELKIGTAMLHSFDNSYYSTDYPYMVPIVAHNPYPFIGKDDKIK